MKRKVVVNVFAWTALLCALALSAAACGKKQAPAAFDPGTKDVNWYCASGPGGGSDIFSRMITDILKAEGISGANFLVTNKTDGGGEVVKAQVSQTTGNLADFTMMTFNSGELMPMVLNTGRRIKDFKPIAIMALDKQLIYIGKSSKYRNFTEVINAVNSGTTVVAGGSKGDDVATFNLMLKELGWTEEQMPYITHNSSNEVIQAILGNHVDLIVSKPAASAPYVEAGEIEAILALSNERYTGDLAGAPTLSEVGPYKNVEFPTWRGVAGPAAMSAEAQAYWSGALKKVSETQTWQNNYIGKFKLVPNYMTWQETTAYIEKFQAEYLASIGKDK
jgi:putative tricarboxylic transport membrane protein